MLFWIGYGSQSGIRYAKFDMSDRQRYVELEVICWAGFIMVFWIGYVDQGVVCWGKFRYVGQAGIC
jgi:hypothetical protein